MGSLMVCKEYLFDLEVVKLCLSQFYLILSARGSSSSRPYKLLQFFQRPIVEISASSTFGDIKLVEVNVCRVI